MTNETEFRETLRAQADTIEVPEDLAQRTMEAARGLEEPSRLDRWRAGRDARRAAAAGPPRWAYAGAAAVVLVGLFSIGQTFTGSPPATLVSGLDDVAAERSVGAPTETRAVKEGFAATSGDSDRASIGDEPVPQPDRIVPVPPPGSPGTFPPKVIKEANLEVEVKEGSFDAAWADANEIASKHGGFVTNSSTELIEDRFASGTLVVRVPSEKLDAALKDFRRLGKTVRMSSSGVDVAGQFVDLDARIRAAKAEETQLLDLMRQARTLSDTLEIRGRLTDVREEIEQLTTQKGFLQSQVDFATLHATVYEPQAAPEDFGPGRFDDAFDKAFQIAQAIFAGTILVLGVLVPLAMIGGVIWLMVALVRRRRSAV